MRVWIILALLVGGATSFAAPVLPPDTDLAHYIPITLNTVSGLGLPGHLAVPKTGLPPYPAVLLLVGNGPVDRYESIPSNLTTDGRPALLFQPIENALLEQGVAVMTYDKPGVTALGNDFTRTQVDWSLYQNADADSLAADAVLAYDTLAGQPLVDKNRLAVLGHGEGTVLALKVAEQRPDVRALFMLGAFTRSMADLLHYQGVTNVLRYFYGLDLDSDGELTHDEYRTATTADPALRSVFGEWANFVGVTDRTGDSRVSAQELNYVLELTAQNVFSRLKNSLQPWPSDGTEGRMWYLQYFAEGGYLQRQLRLCSKIHLFQGQIDVQTPFEDALQLADGCNNARTPLASFNSYAGEGHGFSPRVGFKNLRDTAGPIDPAVPEQIAREAAAALTQQ